MKNILITGALGFCGMHLAKRFQDEKECTVVGSDIYPVKQGKGFFTRYIQADLTEPKAVDRMIQEVKPDEVYHLGACFSGANEVMHRTNLHGTVCLLDAHRRHAPDAKILLVGTAAEYGIPDPSNIQLFEEYPCNPVSSYGISKHEMVLAGLDYWRKYQMKIVVARPFNIVGAGVPFQLVVGSFLERLKKVSRDDKDGVIQVGNVNNRRDFVAIEDALEAFIRLVDGEHWGEIVNVCTGHSVEIRTIFKTILSQSNINCTLEVDPALVGISDIPIVCGSPEKAKRLISFSPSPMLDNAVHAAWSHVMGKVS